MSAFTHIPSEFAFEHRGGNFTAKKSVWQNTLDKTRCTYIIELEGFGEYVEVKLMVNTDDWVADSIEAVNKQTLELAMPKFISDTDMEDDTLEPDAPVQEGAYDETAPVSHAFDPLGANITERSTAEAPLHLEEPQAERYGYANSPIHAFIFKPE